MFAASDTTTCIHGLPPRPVGRRPPRRPAVLTSRRAQKASVELTHVEATEVKSGAIDLRVGDQLGALEVVDTITVTTSTGTRVLVTTEDGSEFDYDSRQNIPATPRY